MRKARFTEEQMVVIIRQPQIEPSSNRKRSDC
jgi:hypothetical protein